MKEEIRECMRARQRERYTECVCGKQGIELVHVCEKATKRTRGRWQAWRVYVRIAQPLCWLSLASDCLRHAGKRL